MFTRHRLPARLLQAVCASAPLVTVAAESVPKPFIVAPNCTMEQQASAAAVAGVASPLACYAFEKWSFKGAGLAVDVTAGEALTSDGFRQLRRAVFRDQSARLRELRDLREAMPGEPPAHSTIPLSLFVASRTPLGVFVESPEYIGFADLVPLTRSELIAAQPSQYPLIHVELLVRRGSQVLRLVLLGQIRGTTTVAEGYRIAEDWALAVLGRERPARQQ